MKAQWVLKLSTVAAAMLVTQGCFGPFKKSTSTSKPAAAAAKATTAGSGSGSTATVTPGTPAASTTAAPAAAVPAVPSAAGAKDGFGCLQGLIVDGFTGQRMDLKGLEDSVFVLIHGKKVKASFYTDETLKGEYYICDIPVEETYPVFAAIKGYLPFESSTKITSTRAVLVSGNQAVTAEVKIPDPIKITNIPLFPVGDTKRGLTVHVVYNGAGVDGATVDLEPVAASEHFAFKGAFASSADTRILPTRVPTDAKGDAVFPPESLSLGVRYEISVSPPNGLDLGTAKRDAFTFGIDGPVAGDKPGAKNNFEMTLVLSNIDTAITVMSCSQQFNDYSPDGSITYIFNRDISQVDIDLAKASLTGGAGALPTDTPNNNKSEQVTVGIDGRKLTLVPIFTGTGAVKIKDPDVTKGPADSQNVDRDVKINFDLSSIKFKVDGDESGDNFTDLATVPKPAACDGSTRIYRQSM